MSFQPEHTLHLMKPRCRVCARALRGMDNEQERLCKNHGRDATTIEAELGRICIGIQDALEDRLRETMFSRWLPYPSNISCEQQWWWKRMMIFSQTCRIAFGYLWPVMISVFINSPVLPVLRVREIEFKTADYYQFWHCAYVITMLDQSIFIFDPTGVQFGPQWPLLAPLDDYAWRMHWPWSFDVFPVGHYYESREEDDSVAALIKRPKDWDAFRSKMALWQRIEEIE